MFAGLMLSLGLGRWHRLAALTIAYAAAISYSLFLAGATLGVPTIWTANAVLIAGLMALERRQGIALLALAAPIHIGLELIAKDPLEFVLLVTLLDTLQVAATAAVLRALRLPTRIRDMRGLLRLTAASTSFTAVTAVVVNGVVALQAGGSFWSGWSDWMTSNVLGVAMIVPTVLILLDHQHRKGFPAKTAETMATVSVVSATAVVVFSRPEPLQVLLFAPALLAVFRGGPRAAAIMVTVSLAVAIPTVLFRAGINPTLALAPLRYAQLFHVVLYAVCLAAALALSRQSRLQGQLVRRQMAARAAQTRAQAASQAKSDFLATISHEIRTPLNSILGFADLVAQDADLSAENRRRLDLVSRAGRSLAEIVNDLLDFAKLESGRLDLNLGPISPVSLLRDAMAIVAPAAEAKGLDLTVEIKALDGADQTALFALDETRLRQVLLNLLGNAVKFTASGGVTARLIVGPAGALRFEVADTGIGIAPDVQSRLFQRFSQADSSISRSYGGTGLGLAISRALVNQMGGEIGVESALGRGARFWIELTAEPVEAIQAPAPTAAAAIEAPGDRAPRVLLVDDHPMNRELGQALLTLAGCEVVTAIDGVDAVDAARAGNFDLILMDVHMPVMDGLAAARAIRAMPGPVSTLPIIALSADVLPEQIARCRAAGMDDHVGKPIHREDLMAAVARALAGRDAEDRSLAQAG